MPTLAEVLPSIGFDTDGLTEFEILEQLRRQIVADPELAARVDRSLTGISANDLFPVPLVPPIEWFAPRGDIPADTKMRVEPNGRIYGRFFEWGTCVIGFSTPGRCVTPFASPDGYQLYHQSDTLVQLENGEQVEIRTGMIAYGHAFLGDPDDPTPSQTMVDHYNDPTRSLVTARAYEDELGGYIVGALLPGSTYADAALARGSALSGHWGYVEGFTTSQGITIESGMHNFGPSAVVRPGAPLMRRPGLLDMTASLTSGGNKHYVGVLEMIDETDLVQPPTAAPAAAKPCTCTIKETAPVTASLDPGVADSNARRLDEAERTIQALESIVADLLREQETAPTIEQAAGV